jgi:DNA-binding NarL/FixJ family response regulator
MVRVLIADDEPLFADLVEVLLGADERIEVVGCVANGGQAILLARELAPDVVLMDLSMPGVSGFEATKQILANGGETRVVVLSGSDDPADVAKAREAGAAGYVTKDRIAEQLVEAVVTAVRGG